MDSKKEKAQGKAKRLMDVAIRRAILMPSAEIYGSPAGFYDYGPVGCAIKRNLENLWRQEFLQKEGFVEIETSVVVPEAVLKASGHASGFADPLATCSVCKNKFRADHLLLQNEAAKKEGGVQKEYQAIRGVVRAELRAVVNYFGFDRRESVMSCSRNSSAIGTSLWL